MGNVTMDARDTISGKMAECFLTINGRRYNFAQAKEIEAIFEKKKVEIPILGKVLNGNRSTGGAGTGTAKFYYNTSIIRENLIDYIKTGKDTYFDMLIVNEDPTSAAGRQEVMLYNCNVNGGVLARIKIDEEALEDEFDFTFDDADLPKSFNLISAMDVK